MGKKIDDPDIKKECPSCGLGVALDATVCEFCGWDFDEEDEWILQIEKLERDLMIEKQKFAPGSVDDRIESTLRSPAEVKAEMLKAAPKPIQKPTPKEPLTPVAQSSRPAPQTKSQAPIAKPVVREAPRPTQQPRPTPPPVVDRVEQPVYRQASREPERPVAYHVDSPARSVPSRTLESSPPVRRVPEPAPEPEGSSKIRKVRTMKAAPEPAPEVAAATPSRRLVRVVKAKKPK